jgi:hypothetical protein
MDQTNHSTSPLANRTNLPACPPEVPHPNDIITWAKQVPAKHKLSFEQQRNECIAKFYNSLLDEAVQTLQSNSPTVTSLPIPLSTWMGLNDLDRRKSFRHNITQKLERTNVCFWKGGLQQNGRLTFKKMTPLEIERSILVRITTLVNRSRKKKAQDEASNSFLVDTVRGAPRENSTHRLHGSPVN